VALRRDTLTGNSWIAHDDVAKKLTGLSDSSA
jgi:hypothetical protein